MICPKCKQELIRTLNTYKCLNNHSFDISKEGYTNLLLSKPFAGDNAVLVNARRDFLNKGFYEPLANKLLEILLNNNCKYIIDCGCGTGYYSNILAKQLKVVGIDISKNAIKVAAKNNKENEYVVASSKNIPYNDQTFDGLINIFAPSFKDEFQRIIKEKGLIIIVLPGKKHLWEIKEILYTSPYLNESLVNPLNIFEVNKINLEYTINLDNQDINNLVSMTPYLYKTFQEDLRKLNDISKLVVTCSFDIFVYKKQSI